MGSYNKNTKGVHIYITGHFFSLNVFKGTNEAGLDLSSTSFQVLGHSH